MKLWLGVWLLLAAPVFAQMGSDMSTGTRSFGNDRIVNYQPASGGDRVKWFAVSTAGPLGLLAAGPISAGFGTAINRPKEYGPHWEGFGDRYGMRLTGVSTGNAMEAGLGALWGEDPRYFPSPRRGFGTRVKYVIRTTFVAPHRDGTWHPAYARYIGNVGNNFLSNTWRVNSENGPGNALVRCVFGVVGRMSGNAFAEFWPDVRKRIWRK
ncbi:MAG TPA: hypothetical protein VLL05_20135 [Terriglobales bacterium]|nr:hypothetical protein [Terriglobales bacterium]